MKHPTLARRAVALDWRALIGVALFCVIAVAWILVVVLLAIEIAA